MPAKATSSQRPGPGWLTAGEMASVFDVAPRTWDSTYRRYANPEAVKHVERRPYFHCRRVIEAWKAAQGPVEKGKADDPLLIGDADSPALEEYRKARARLAWMEVDQREGTHVPLAELEPALLNLSGVMRQALDTLARRFGNDAAAIVNEALEQWDAGLDKQLHRDADASAAEEDRPGDPHPAVADNAGVR